MFFPNNTFTYSFRSINENIKNDSIIVNCTSIGLNSEESPLSNEMINENQTVIDVIYKANGSKLINLAKKKGARVMDGLDMFIYQGLISHEIWFDNKIIDKLDIDMIRQYLRESQC